MHINRRSCSKPIENTERERKEERADLDAILNQEALTDVAV